MKNHVLSSLVSVLFFGFATAAWAGYTFENGVLTVDGATDLNGSSLTIEGIKSIKGDAKFTNTAEGDSVALTLGVEKGASVSLSELSGNLKIVKTGEGTLTLPKTSSYSGGTEVRGGVLNANSGNTRKLQSTFRPYGTGTALDVYGGTLEGKAYTDWSSYHVLNLRGGTFKNTAANNTSTSAFNVPINLFDDSTYSLSANYSLAGKVDLGGRTLTMSIAGNSLYFNPASVQNGTLYFKGTTGTCTLEKTLSLDTVDVVIASKFDLNGKTFDMRDLTVESTGVVSGAGALRVHGVLHTTGGASSSCTMMNRSTIDLSKVTEAPWSDGTVRFDSEAQTVTIALGDRVLEANQKIVSWDAKPEGVTFGFTGTGIEETEFSVTEVGIVYRAVSEGIAVATWIGGGSDDWGAATNWDCRNARGERLADAVPDETMTVVVTGDVSALKLSSDFPFAGVRFLNAYLSTSPDWSGFDFGRVAEDSLLDTKGVALELTTWGTSSVTPLTITNTSETEGLLTVNVPEGVLFTNDTLSVSGNLKFVKTGLGTLVAERYPQTYAGETVVEEGVLRAADNSNVNATEKGSPFGALRTITVGAAGVLDPRGSYAWSYHTINLAGGMISNTVARYGVSSDQYNAASRRDPFNPTISLLDDSILATPVNHNFSGKLKTNGHTLTAWIKSGCSLRWIPDSAPFASVVVTGGGWFYTLKNLTMNEKTFDLTMVNGYFHLGGSLTVSNYLAQAKGNTFDYENNASPTMKVYGTFTPESEHFVGCTMQNGSTIDLSGKTEPWKSQGFAWGKGDVDFAEGATVTIDVHGRSFTRRTQIVKWTKTSATSAAGASFVLDAASKATGLRLVAEPYDEANPDVGGLYVERRGLVLLFQ